MIEFLCALASRRIWNLGLEETLHPIETILQASFYPHVEVKCHKVCNILLDILKQEFNLMQHFTYVRVSMARDLHNYISLEELASLWGQCNYVFECYYVLQFEGI